MDAALTVTLARVILYLHFLVVAFNIAGLILIPLGAARGWSFHRIYWPLPFWAFVVLYLAALVFTLWLWRLVPPERKPAL